MERCPLVLLFCADPGFAKTSPTTEDQRTKSNLSVGTEQKNENKSSHAILEEILKKLYAVCNKIFFAKNLVLERKPANTELRSLTYLIISPPEKNENNTRL